MTKKDLIEKCCSELVIATNLLPFLNYIQLKLFEHIMSEFIKNIMENYSKDNKK